MRFRTQLALVVGLTFAADANAYIYVGNPAVTFRVDRPAGDITSSEGTLDKLRVHKCGGGKVDYAVDETLDLVKGSSLTIDAGDLCGLSFVWASSVVSSNGSWTVEYDELVTSVMLNGNPSDTFVGLTPFEVISGSWSGGFPPRLYVEVQE